MAEWPGSDHDTVWHAPHFRFKTGDHGHRAVGRAKRRMPANRPMT
jgi:hypothetical protein